MSRACKYRIVELWDNGCPVLVQAAQAGEDAPWRLTWRYRDRLPANRLIEWFRTLTTEPTEKTLFSILVTEREARAVVALRLEEIARMAGCPAGTWPDFILLDKPTNCGKRGRRCVVVDQGEITTYSSIAAMGRAEGVTRKTASRRVRRLPTRRGKATF